MQHSCPSSQQTVTLPAWHLESGCDERPTGNSAKNSYDTVIVHMANR